MESTPFLTFCGGPGFIYGPIWGSFVVQFWDHLRSGDHLRAGIICRPVEISLTIMDFIYMKPYAKHAIPNHIL